MELNRLCMNCMQFTLEGKLCANCHAVMPITQASANALPIGTVLNGRYLVGRVLGEGGFGITYLACDLQTQQRVAVKEYYPETLSVRVEGATRVTNKDCDTFLYGLQKFEDEAQTIHRLRYLENLVHIQSLFRENGTAYYVMEYLQGKDLRNLLKARGGCLPFDEIVTLLKPLFGCIQQIHNAGVIHRDISPDNIFVCDSGQVKLIDFGTAKVFLSNRNTMTKNVAIKQGFAALEQYLTNGRQGPWTDVYAMACTVYRCITGRVPPYAVSRTAVDPLVPPSQLCVIPADKERVLLRGMAVQVEDRFPTMAEFANKLMPDDAPVPAISEAVPLFGRRMLAALLDNLLFWLPSLVLLLCAPQVYAWWQLPWGAAFSAICATLEHCPMQATLGKRLLRLCVTGASGRSASWGRLFVRDLLRFGILPFQALFVFSGGKRAYHETLTGTRVLAAFEQTRPETPTVTLGAAYTLQGVSGVYANQQLELTESPVVFGRDGTRCSLVFPAGTPGVSSVHCSLRLSDGVPLLEDMNSSYGTVVNQQSPRQGGAPQKLQRGDTFTIGTQSFTIL